MIKVVVVGFESLGNKITITIVIYRFDAAQWLQADPCVHHHHRWWVVSIPIAAREDEAQQELPAPAQLLQAEDPCVHQ
jgi:hypothetical protein